MKGSAALKKRNEEILNEEVRTMLRQPENRFCFECGQRGPTYVNITNGSFCCMHCSGLLRGLNPPHRVKSISMAKFNQEEVERLRCSGNKYNSRVFLGLYSGKVIFEPRDDEAVKSHLIDKYENKRWYVSPDDIQLQSRLLQESTTLGSVPRRNSGGAQSVKSHKSNQSAPPNLHIIKPQGQIDLLTGDLFDLSVNSKPADPLPSAPVPSVSKPVNSEDDWTTLFMGTPSKFSVQPTNSLPFNPTTSTSVHPHPTSSHLFQPTSSSTHPFQPTSYVPPPLQCNFPSIPPPKSKEHHTSHNVTQSISHSTNLSQSNQTGNNPPPGWITFSNFPKSATVTNMPEPVQPTQPQSSQSVFDIFGPPTPSAKKVPPPLPSSRPVGDVSQTPINPPLPVINNSDNGTPNPNWNPFL